MHPSISDQHSIPEHRSIGVEDLKDPARLLQKLGGQFIDGQGGTKTAFGRLTTAFIGHCKNGCGTAIKVKGAAHAISNLAEMLKTRLLHDEVGDASDVMAAILDLSCVSSNDIPEPDLRSV
jgi:hypothetical protein